MYYHFDIQPVLVVLFEISVIATLISLAIFLRRILPLHKQRRASNRRDGSLPDGARDGASIIVYSNDQSAELESLLPQLLRQQYAPGYEVIVVNEGDSPRVRAVVEDLQMTHRNLYLTFTPDGARNLSRKKLALTLGIKAARYPVAVMTAAGASVGSDGWLARIMQHFSENNHTEVVLGYAAFDPDDDSGAARRVRSFDYVAESASWIADAVKGRPWRGTEYNLAYRRDLFFRNKGFSRHLNLRYGDDDIFISEIATGANTVVELSDDSVVTILGGDSRRAALDRSARRRFTERFIRRRPRLLDAIGRWAYLIALLTPVAAVAMDVSNGFVWTCAGVALLCWYLAGMVWCNVMTALRGRRLIASVPFILALSPLRRIYRRLYAMARRSKRYTWE
ncbi:MAG: hypothetical protein Q4C34_01055 [Bacteroidales bacterium]|nr:hypothetical protein [Bacteroidales bacterium]